MIFPLTGRHNALRGAPARQLIGPSTEPPPARDDCADVNAGPRRASVDISPRGAAYDRYMAKTDRDLTRHLGKLRKDRAQLAEALQNAKTAKTPGIEADAGATVLSKKHRKILKKQLGYLDKLVAMTEKALGLEEKSAA